MQLRILKLTINTTRRVNNGSRRYPAYASETETTEEETLQYRAGDSEEWQDVEIVYDNADRSVD